MRNLAVRPWRKVSPCGFGGARFRLAGVGEIGFAYGMGVTFFPFRLLTTSQPKYPKQPTRVVPEINRPI